MRGTFNRITLAIGGPVLLAGVLGGAITFAQEGTETPDATTPETTPAPDTTTSPEDDTKTPDEGTTPGDSREHRGYNGSDCDKDGAGGDSEGDAGGASLSAL